MTNENCSIDCWLTTYALIEHGEKLARDHTTEVLLQQFDHINEYYRRQQFLDRSTDVLRGIDFALDFYEFSTGGNSLISGSWMAVGAAQLIDDRSNNLYPEERIGRAAIVTLEGLAVDQLSIYLGQKAFERTFIGTWEAGPIVAFPMSATAGVLTFVGVQFAGDYVSNYLNQNWLFPAINGLSESNRTRR